MQFRTEAHTSSADRPMNYSHKALFMGSCFSVHMHQKMHDLKFDVASNPFGIVYNPVSLNAQLERVLENTPYSEKDIDFHNERWFSFDHHSDFSFSSKTECLEAINTSIELAHQQLLNSDFLFLTLGSSWVYKKIDSQQVVSNCHKIPAKNFDRYLAETADMVTGLKTTLSKIKQLNPSIHIVFSVSPVRHLSDGFFENQVSKGRLFDVILQLQKEMESISYFGAYELLQDDLRDYRFYGEDLVHPSGEAIKYIWEKFKKGYISSDSDKIIKDIEKITRSVQHRPFNPNSDGHQKFISKTLQEIERLEKLVPGHFDAEKEILESALKG